MSVVASEEVVQGSDLETPTWVTSYQGLPRTVNVRRCRLEVVAGADTGKVIELAQNAIQVGRVGADLNLNDAKVSGLHCELRLQPDGYRLKDLGSTNGTYVKGVRVIDAFIAPGATIQIGKSAIAFTPLDEAVAMPLWSEARLHNLVGGSAAMRHLFELINRFAQSDATVLIQGETGSGKELIAQAIHRESNRAARPFIAVDCGAIPEALLESELFGHEKGAFTGADRKRVGQFQLAEGGTLFLDEIGNLPATLHAKLLRALESREIAPVGGTRKTALDIRFVAATNVDLRDRVRDGRFREDLYFRLAQYTVSLPALRERAGDIPHLARRFQAEACREMRRPVVDIAPDALALLQRQAWPGNVRELRNVVRQAVLHAQNMVVSADLIRLVMREPPDRAGAPGGDAAARPLREVAEQAVRDAETAAIRAALRAAGGNKAAAAKALQTDYKTLHLKLQRYGIKADDFK